MVKPLQRVEEEVVVTEEKDSLRIYLVADQKVGIKALLPRGYLILFGELLEVAVDKPILDDIADEEPGAELIDSSQTEGLSGENFVLRFPGVEVLPVGAEVKDKLGDGFQGQMSP